MKDIFLDFDGTVVEHAYPQIGLPNPFALEVIKKLQDKPYRIILNTTRVEFADGSLQAALDYLNLNPTVKGINIQHYTSRKLLPPPWNKNKLKNAENIYIDDTAAGIPLIESEEHGYMVNWKIVESQLTEAGLLNR